MLKPLKQFLRKHDPYFRSMQILQEQMQTFCTDRQIQLAEKEQAVRDCQSHLTVKEQELQSLTADYQKQLAEKEQTISRLNADYQRQLAAKNQDIENQKAEYRKQLAEKEQTISRLNADYQAQLTGKKREIEQLHTEYQKILSEKDQSINECRMQLIVKEQSIQQLQTECQKISSEKEQTINRLHADYQAQLAEKEQTINRLNADYQAQLAEKEQTINRITVDCQKKLRTSFSDYQASLKQLLHDPSIREDHLCGICGNLMQYSFSKKIMNKYEISYFSCEHCEHVQTEKPYWLEEAYHSALSDSDTGQVWRNERNRDIVCAIAQRFLPESPKVLEFAAGYGLLTRMLRDAGMECFWSDKYAENTFARHFEDDGKRQYDLVLAFEALEHFEEPMKELENIFSRGASLLFSEILLPDLCPNQWWYLCTEHGQHVNFYSLKTLQYIAERFHRNLYIHEDVGMITPLEISQEDFADTLTHVDLFAEEFRKSHHALTVEDMNTVIKEMRQA